MEWELVALGFCGTLIVAIIVYAFAPLLDNTFVAKVFDKAICAITNHFQDKHRCHADNKPRDRGMLLHNVGCDGKENYHSTYEYKECAKPEIPIAHARILSRRKGKVN